MNINVMELQHVATKQRINIPIHSFVLGKTSIQV